MFSIHFSILCVLFLFALSLAKFQRKQRSALKNFPKLTGKYLCRNRSETLLRKSHRHRYFSVIFAIFLEHLFLDHFRRPSLSLLLETPIVFEFFILQFSFDKTSLPTTKATGSEILLEVVYYEVKSWCISQAKQVGYDSGSGTIDCLV